MSKILDEVDKLAQQNYAPVWKTPAIRKFIETGDEELLKNIPLLHNSWLASGLTGALPNLEAWTDEASRVIRLAQAKDIHSLLFNWLMRYCHSGSPGWTHFHSAVRQLKSVGLSDAEISKLLLEGKIWNEQTQQPTPASELALGSSDAEIAAIIKQSYGRGCQLLALLAHSQPERLEKLLAEGLISPAVSTLYEVITRANPNRFAAQAFDIFKQMPDRSDRVRLVTILAETVPSQYLDAAGEEVRSYLCQDQIDDDVTGRTCAEFMLQHDLPDALYLASKWVAGGDAQDRWYQARHQRRLILRWAREQAPKLVLPLAEACARSLTANVVLLGLEFWKQHGIGDTSSRFHDAIRRVLTQTDPSAILSAIAEAREWDLQRTSADLWPLLLHKSRPVRGAAARALAALGYAEAGARAGKLLEHKKAEVRQTAVLLLNQLGGGEALHTLKHHLDREENDDVRDNILLTLESSGQGAAFSSAERQERIAKTLAKTKAPLPAWIHPGALVFRKQDGRALTAEEVLYLLIRQSRCPEMRADLEAKPLYAELDRPGSAEAALTLLQAFRGTAQAASDRWVLALAALTGDDRLVPVLHKAILDWVEHSRGKLAEYGTQALALLGTDAALMVVDSLSVRFRSKNKNIGQAAADAFAAAAERRGVTIEELGDLVVPWLGFQPGEPRLIEVGKTPVEARIDAAFKLGFREVKTGKTLAKLPAGMPAEVQTEFKTLAGTLKEAVKAQLLRLETLLVRQFRWPVPRWRGLYLAHPLLRPFTQRLVWGWRDAAGELRSTFRALEDGSLTDVADETVTLPEEGSVSLVHPLDLSEEARTAWLGHLADYDVTPPFPQLDRPVVRVKPEEAGLKFGRSVNGTELKAITFRSRAEKLGWSRGSVCDGGGITSYRKIFSGAGIEVFLALEGMHMGIDLEATINLGEFCFVQAGSVTVGSYTYDEPSQENDPRLLAFGNVPPVPFSEVMGDLSKIAGTSNQPELETN